MIILIQGRSAFAELLRLLAKHVEEGAIAAPPSIHPAPHLGDFAVRIGGFDYDLASGLPGVTPDPGRDDDSDPWNEEVTEPGLRRRWVAPGPAEP